MTTIESITTPTTTILYCDACGMPPEYCEYGPDFETHCVPWLKKVHPILFGRLHGDRSPGGGGATVGGAGGDNDEGGVSARGGGVKPKAPWTTRQRLTAFYTKYQPDKLNGIDSILTKYSGKEDKLFMALVKKYGEEPCDPYYSDSDDDDGGVEGVEGVNEQMEGMGLHSKSSKNKRRGASAKKVNK